VQRGEPTPCIEIADATDSGFPTLALHGQNERAIVIRRKVSAGTRSDLGRNCRDAFLGLAKTFPKLGVAFWVYFGSRLQIPGQCIVPYLPDFVRFRGQPA
jgi:hypothetical protein